MDQQIPEIRISRGLQGIYADRTETTYIDGKEGTLEYRGYSIHDLAENSTFEEVAYLLLYGSLPNKTELNKLDQELKAARGLPTPILDIIAQIKAAHPMDVLRTAVSALSAYDPDSGDKSPEATYRVGIRLTSQVSEIIMAHHNIVAGRDPIAPNREISHAANFLYMMNGKMPSERGARTDGQGLRTPRRPRTERLGVHRACSYQYRREHPLRCNRGNRRAIGTVARWSRRKRGPDG